MAQERFDATLDLARRIDTKLLIEEVQQPSPAVPAPTEEEANAVDQLFAAEQKEQDEPHPFVDAISLAAAGMLLHDIVKDTMAPAEDDDEEEKAKAKPKPKSPEPK